jgi:serine/threonine protein kinase
MFDNIQRGPLKLPVTMSPDAKSIIIGLLNRNPLKRLGSGFGGIMEIKMHPFLEDIDWEQVSNRQLPVPKPR